ncbi:RibD family protein [bacterium]|nr:RibD family protein [bacterium]
MKRIITNTAISLDGRISIEPQKHVWLGSSEDQKRMQALRGEADAVLIGGQSFRNNPFPLLPLPEQIWKTGFCNVIVTRSDPLSLPLPDAHLVQRLFITSAQPVNKPVDREILYKNNITPSWIVEELEKRGVETLLIEGGGDLIYQFIKAGLVHELYVTLTPRLVGKKGSPTLCDGDGFGDFKNLDLVSCEKVGSEVFLRYKML